MGEIVVFRATRRGVASIVGWDAVRRMGDYEEYIVAALEGGVIIIGDPELRRVWRFRRGVVEEVTDKWELREYRSLLREILPSLP